MPSKHTPQAASSSNPLDNVKELIDNVKHLKLGHQDNGASSNDSKTDRLFSYLGNKLLGKDSPESSNKPLPPVSPPSMPVATPHHYTPSAYHSPPYSTDDIPYRPNPLPRPPALISMPVPYPHQHGPSGYGSDLGGGFVVPGMMMTPDTGQLQPPHVAHSYSAPSVPLPIQSASKPSTPQPEAKKGKKRQSTLSDTEADNDVPSEERCAGSKKNGERCGRPVKTTSALTSVTGATVERYCFQHAPSMLEQTGFYWKNLDSNWIKFEDYIPKYLQEQTQISLRGEMEKPLSAGEEEGYIYCFQIRDPNTPGHVHFKVGRTDNFVKRMNEWKKQCPNKPPIVRGCWPSTDSDLDSYQHGRLKNPENKGPNTHRLERLIHLELADLALNSPYLHPKFPKITAGDLEEEASTVVASSTPNKRGRKKVDPDSDARLAGKKCSDCGAVHKEIFTFKKVTRGKYKDQEWAEIVEKVINKWGGFVTRYT